MTRPDTLTVAAVLFDLDGTLVDTTAAVDTAWRRAAAELGVPFERFAHSYHGIPAQVTLATVVPQLSPDERRDWARRINAWQAADDLVVAPTPGARALLASIPAVRWAVVTSGDTALAEANIRRAGLPRPLVLVTADDVARGKPDPEPFLTAAAAVGADPADCLAVEDAPAGIAAAAAAGMRCVALTTTYPADVVAQADWTVPDLRRVQVRTIEPGGALAVDIAS
ncbi:HAD-IA family hydrolase [Jatrophihabitans sp. YIM 134969]